MKNEGYGILHLKTKEAYVVFTEEIKGQISDGAWENSRPYDHWIFWSNTNAIVDGNLGLEIKEGTPLKRNYNLFHLIPYVGDRMLAYIASVKMDKDPTLTNYLMEFTNLIKNPGQDSYWINKSNLVKKEFGEDIDSAVKQVQDVINSLGNKTLKDVLSEISTAMKTNY